MDRSPLPTPARARALRTLLTLLALAALSAVQAHGSLVLGAVSLSPDPPVPGRPLVISVVLATSGNAPVERAKLAAELTPAPASGSGTAEATASSPAAPATTAPVPVPLSEYPEPYGTYRATVTAPPVGSYLLTVHDRTYASENVAASVTLRVGGGTANGALDFTFPPTGAPRSVLSWLLWLVGLPLAVGVVVTVLVLRSKRSDDAAEG